MVLSGFLQTFMTGGRRSSVENPAKFCIFVYKRQNYKAIPAYSATLF
jgi:hypothetical protein